jgi:multidrug efflux pump subunit AcrA (membrane-fusion protein)
MRIFEMDLQEARAELKRLESNADKMLVRAPLEGIVVMRTIFRGQEQGQIMKGDQLMPGQPFMQIVDTSAMVVNSWLNQVDAEQVRVGAKATVRFDAFSDLALPATVQVIGSMPQAGGWRASYVKQIPILLKLDRLDPRVIPDLSISADVVVEREEGMVIVPLEAVFREGPGASPFVFVRGPTGWEKRPVELGLSNFVAVAVRSGLRPGEWVALERPERLSTQ